MLFVLQPMTRHTELIPGDERQAAVAEKCVVSVI